MVINVCTLILYGIDKFLAKAEWKRVPERWLHTLSLIGGFAGAWVGMKLFNHKTSKPKFRLVMLAGLLLHTAFFAILMARMRWF